MESLVAEYAQKLCQADLGEDSGIHAPLVAGLDDTLVWNRKAPETVILLDLFEKLHMNSLVFLRPRPPYRQILSYLSEQARQAADPVIRPKDCETITFFHDLPVVFSMDADVLASALEHRKVVVVAPEYCDKNHAQPPGIIAPGHISPEQGFVSVSSACFASYVKFFTDYLDAVQSRTLKPDMTKAFDQVLPFIKPLQSLAVPELMKGPFTNEDQVRNAMTQAGRLMVEMGLVDSYFGNVSYCMDNILYISQTASSLDDLYDCIDPVPMDGSSSAGITASSELAAHLETISRSPLQAILHGHPKFSVIMSMAHFGQKKGFVGHIPVVEGDVGTGASGLCHTLPKVLCRYPAVLVQGHGVFTTGEKDFSQAFARLMNTEIFCQDLYMEIAGIKNGL